MNKLHSFTFYALITPAMTLGASSVLAEKSADQDMDSEQWSTIEESSTMDHKKKSDDKHTDSGSHPAVEHSQRDKNQQSISEDGKQRAMNSGSHPAAENSQRDKSHTKNQGYTASAAANGMQASDLIGAEVSTSSDEKVGSVRDLILDENGQVVAIVVGAGGFLGLGEKDVAIGWDNVTRSDSSDEQELRIDMTRDELRDAPKFEMQD
ncbi:sporulation protein YlmC with PRC-barrel domain [Methylohalomonas lacus]|uniref:Sporulation protein YlmC with PRC-barrel domain n=1 Tax=Methylohalomonas lacus TaxID=398773 RepID=A0AAE3L0Y7_9GAMM|nr:PRC-barrel domain-containing protein [Methylohalomonas lacus]MCS3902830.1 sporulation protein YlmC with PRC-barrel domain [Methylohalomonas lacus]